MSVTEKVSRDVPSDIQKRGRSYFMDGAVEILDADDRSVEAQVSGSDDYRVSLKLVGKKLRVCCSCPYFEKYFAACKHIWATLMAADVASHLRAADALPSVRLTADETLADAWEDEEDGADEWDDGEEYFDEPEALPQVAPPARPRPAARRPPKARPLPWKKQLAQLREPTPSSPYAVSHRGGWHAGKEILYVVDVPATLTSQAGLLLEVAMRERKRNGDWGKPKAVRLSLAEIAHLPDAGDRQVMAFLTGAREHNSYYAGFSSYYGYDSAPARYLLSEAMLDALVPLLCRTGRCRLRRAPDDEELPTLHWDDAGPWEFWLDVTPSGKDYVVSGSLRRGEQRLPLEAPLLLLSGGLVVEQDRAAPLQDFGAFKWITLLRGRGPLTVPAAQKDELLQELLKLPQLPRLDLPEELRYEEVQAAPRPRLTVKPPEKRGWPGYDRLRGELSFDYDGASVAATDRGRGVYETERRRFVLRDPAAEAVAAEKLRQLGFRPSSYYNHPPGLELAPRNLPRVVRTLLAEGWHVEAEGKVYRNPGELRIEVSSGIDWFELHGTVQFDDLQASLPALLAALKRGENTVRLDDGTFGMLPEDWLKKYGTLAGLGMAEDDHLRFTRAQVGLLDALLAAQPEASCDAVFAQARDELRRFEGIEALDPPAGFVGELRGYQRDGLGWLHFLPRFGFGGCLADDMGLGKTVQVLALLESRRELRAGSETGSDPLSSRGPIPFPTRPPASLVVVPRSLIFNWKQEAARFTPQLRILDHTGLGRADPGEHFHDYDVVLTTYGTLRRDILKLKDVAFDWCILDEAQAVKNANTNTAKAVRLLQASHRLALSGTPVENHLGELWSLFEFLNPGMLGSASVFRLGGAGARNPDEETRKLLARALRPFILRRRKEQVAKDLPQKLEQTLYCELEPAQRKLYDELRQHYRQALLDRVARDGLAKSKIQVLEALLRLRQAACHPGLIDKERGGEASAKLDLLVPQLAEVVEEGHKVLVFSQFTSLLALVRSRLDADGVTYEYLDGRTRNRQEKVERFQNDPACKLFLISLKAGGLGLNLTAAEYVYLLDPWWNPAVEAQAIDRTHRIGQTKPVFAYRLIAKDTVEEKVLELQKTKRDLADAILSADNSLIRDLSQEDLQLLLS